MMMEMMVECMSEGEDSTTNEADVMMYLVEPTRYIDPDKKFSLSPIKS